MNRPSTSAEGLRHYVTLTDITNCVIYSAVAQRLSAAEVAALLPLPQAVFQILVALADQDRHGYAIMQDVAARTDGALKLSPGRCTGRSSACSRTVSSSKSTTGQRPSEDDERRRYYRITQIGRDLAQAEADRLTVLLRQARAVGLTPRRA